MDVNETPSGESCNGELPPDMSKLPPDMSKLPPTGDTANPVSEKQIITLGECDGQISNVTNHLGLIDNSGICTSCSDAEAKKCFVQCFQCKSLFHGVCRNADGDRKNKEIICPRTFYNAYSSMIESSVYKTRPGNFLFM